MTTTSLIVDINNIRCGRCKMLIKNQQAQSCNHCNATFDRVGSNHAGLADKLRAARGEPLVGESVPKFAQVDLVSS